jgi:hypothetical protein
MLAKGAGVDLTERWALQNIFIVIKHESPSSYIAIECGHNSPANGFDTLICNKCAEQISCITSCGVEGGRGVQQKKRAFFGYFAASESSGELRFGKLKRCDHSHEVTTAADATR